jgi:hypothetical protein
MLSARGCMQMHVGWRQAYHKASGRSKMGLAIIELLSQMEHFALKRKAQLYYISRISFTQPILLGCIFSVRNCARAGSGRLSALVSRYPSSKHHQRGGGGPTSCPMSACRYHSSLIVPPSTSSCLLRCRCSDAYRVTPLTQHTWTALLMPIQGTWFLCPRKRVYSLGWLRPSVTLPVSTHWRLT